MQVKKSFDGESVKKMFKGALIAASGAAGIAFLQSIGQADVSSICTEQAAWFCNGWLIPFVAFGVPTGINTIKEWLKGD